mmetsp:Transcript_36724/g.79500  ORF Transcript_36724/g.79500 Transcript_36724/m.79500 type:complete len:378 (+) Transcript_36724:1490-2623(+)
MHRVVVSAVKLLVVLGEEHGRALHEQPQVRGHREGDLRALVVHHREQRALDPLQDLLVDVRNGHREVQEDPNGGEHQRRVGMLEPVLENVHDVEGLVAVLRPVHGDELQQRALRPLAELLEPIQQRVDHRLGDQVLRRAHNLLQDGQRVGYHLRVAVVGEHLLQLRLQLQLLDDLRVQPEHLEHPEHRRAPHVRIPVVQSRLQWADEVLDQVRHAQGAQRAQREPPHRRVAVAAVLGQRVDRQQRQVRLLLRVRADVQIQHLLQHDVVRRRARDNHLREEARHVHVDRHVVQDALEEAPLDQLRVFRRAALSLPGGPFSPILLGRQRAVLDDRGQLRLEVADLALGLLLGRHGVARAVSACLACDPPLRLSPRPRSQ